MLIAIPIAFLLATLFSVRITVVPASMGVVEFQWLSLLATSFNPPSAHVPTIDALFTVNLDKKVGYESSVLGRSYPPTKVLEAKLAGRRRSVPGIPPTLHFESPVGRSIFPAISQDYSIYSSPNLVSSSAVVAAGVTTAETDDLDAPTVTLPKNGESFFSSLFSSLAATTTARIAIRPTPAATTRQTASADTEPPTTIVTTFWYRLAWIGRLTPIVHLLAYGIATYTVYQEIIRRQHQATAATSTSADDIIKEQFFANFSRSLQDDYPRNDLLCSLLRQEGWRGKLQSNQDGAFVRDRCYE